MDNKDKIVNFLGKHPQKAFTMHDLSQRLKVPYASFYRTIKKIADLLRIEKIGMSKVLSLNYANSIVKAHLSIASDEERKDYLQKQPLIKLIHGELSTSSVVVLFGSYASQTQTHKSDIDLLIINKTGGKDISFAKYELLYKKKINPIFLTKKEFKLMLIDKDENVGKQALSNHIILNNPQDFWRFAFNGIRQAALWRNF